MMKTILVIFTLMTAQAFAVSKSIVRFPADLEISHQSQYSLLDLAQVENPQNQILKQLFKAQVPVKWTQGSRWTLTAHQILEVLKKNRVSQKNVEFFIPESIKPKKSNNILSATHLKRVILMITQAECKACDFKIDLYSVPKVLLSDWEWDPFSVNFRGSFTALIKMPDTRWSGWLTGSVRWKGPVVSPRRSVSFQEKIQESDLDISDKDITYAKDVITEKSEAVGQIAARTLSPSGFLTRADIKKEPLVKRGQMVKAMMGEDDFEISIMSVAEETGFAGDMIKVKNVDSSKLLSAVIVDRGVVRVQ